MFKLCNKFSDTTAAIKLQEKILKSKDAAEEPPNKKARGMYFQCEVCLKLFANKYDLKRHQRTHTEEKS